MLKIIYALHLLNLETAWWNLTKFWQSVILIDHGSAISSLGSCNTPDVTFPICTPTLAVSGVKLYLFSRVWVFFSVCCCRCHASHIMSSCALHLHTCSSHAFEHLPRFPFCIPALRSPPVAISSFISCVGIKHF